MDHPLLSLQHLVKDFQSGSLIKARPLRAVDGVDLEIYPGETLGLVGESGCGKSTLARCALRLIEPTSGNVLFDGKDLTALSQSSLRRLRREFQIIFQDPFSSLNPRMTVSDIIREPYEVHGLGTRSERESWVGELMAAVTLDTSFRDRRPLQLSGGQQQRVSIARALALRPRLLIADEPVSALDPSVQAQILNLLSDLQVRYNLTLLLISHSLPVVHYVSTRVAVMYLGQIIEEAPAEHFFEQPKHPYSQALVRNVPVLDKSSRNERQALVGEIPSMRDPPDGCRFHPRCPKAMPECCEKTPPLLKHGKNKVACFLYPEEDKQGDPD